MILLLHHVHRQLTVTSIEVLQGGRNVEHTSSFECVAASRGDYDR